MKNIDQAIKYFNNGNIEQAEALCTALCANTHSSDPASWRLLSAIYLKLGKYADAERASLQSLELDKDNSESYYYHGLALFRQGKLDDAINPFQIVLSSNPDMIECYLHLSSIYNHLGEALNSIKILSKAHKQSPKNTNITCLLADALEKANQSEESRKLVTQALLESQYHPVAHLVSARLEIRDGHYKQAISILGKLLRYDNIGDTNLINIQYLLGKSHDRLGDYNNALSAFQTANKTDAKRYKDKFNKNIILDRIYRYKGAIQKELTNKWPSLPHNRKIDSPVFLVSFPRSGTTLTEQILASHSKVLTSDERPLIQNTSEKFISMNNTGLGFPYTINNLQGKEIEYLREYYLHRAHEIQPDLGSKVFIDKLPLNIIEVGFIMRLFSNPKFILLIRDPRDVCLSCFMQSFIPNHAMANFLTLEDASKFYAATMDLWIHYTSIFNLNVHQLKYEDLINNTQTEIRKTLDFLELKWEDNILKDRHRNKKTVSTPSYQDIASPIYNRAIKRWENYSDAFSEAQKILSPYVKHFGY